MGQDTGVGAPRPVLGSRGHRRLHTGELEDRWAIGRQLLDQSGPARDAQDRHSGTTYLPPGDLQGVSEQTPVHRVRSDATRGARDGLHDTSSGAARPADLDEGVHHQHQQRASAEREIADLVRYFGTGFGKVLEAYKRRTRTRRAQRGRPRVPRRRPASSPPALAGIRPVLAGDDLAEHRVSRDLPQNPPRRLSRAQRVVGQRLPHRLPGGRLGLLSGGVAQPGMDQVRAHDRGPDVAEQGLPDYGVPADIIDGR